MTLRAGMFQQYVGARVPLLSLDLLELLASENTPVSTTVLAERLGVSVQSTNNLLRVLFRRGYVSQDRSRHYRLGPQLCVFGDSTARWENLLCTRVTFTQS